MLQVKHKGIIFSRDAKQPHRLNFIEGDNVINSCDIPGSGIISLELVGKKGIKIECGEKTFRFVFHAVNDWKLFDVTPQHEVKPVRKEGK